MMKRIAVLALQGAFIEHEHMLHSLGYETVELRQKRDFDISYDGIILPGGESTVQAKLLEDLEMLAPLQRQIQNGLPVLATCAGMILLTNTFCTFPATVKRNAYGRQLGSFQYSGNIKGLGTYPMTFIRAPYFTEFSSNVEVLATVNGHVVAARYKNQLALAFHPEVTHDTRIHELFISMCHAEKAGNP